jgi:hypothetical protein
MLDLRRGAVDGPAMWLRISEGLNQLVSRPLLRIGKLWPKFEGFKIKTPADQ